MKAWLRYGGLFLLLVIVGYIGWYARIQYAHAHSLATTMTQIREYSTPTGLTNPLLYIDVNQPSTDLDPLKNEIQSYVNTALNQKQADAVSVYFRDLNTSKWTGINENDPYEPSSMLKVMVMMTYLEKADEDPAILQQKFYYEAKPDPGQHYKPSHILSTGMHTVEELIDAMIIDSDNDAAAVLTANNTKSYIELFNILRLPYPKDNSIIDFMSPKSYSVLFRTLYSGTYLSHGFSEKALETLTETTFRNGLVAGVPNGTIVAHKFGEHTEEKSDGSVLWHELHDCGIIYSGTNPYLLCVMTKGQDFSKLESVISTISQKIYTEVNP